LPRLHFIFLLFFAVCLECGCKQSNSIDTENIGSPSFGNDAQREVSGEQMNIDIGATSGGGGSPTTSDNTASGPDSAGGATNDNTGSDQESAPIFPLVVFPQPHQGPYRISSYCWNVGSTDKLRWGTVASRIQLALRNIGLDSKVWAYGLPPFSGFVVVSEIQSIDSSGIASGSETSEARQFLFVLGHDVVRTDHQPARLEDFKTYYEDGAAELPNSLAYHHFVNTAEDGDHLYVMVYRFERKPFEKDMDLINEDLAIDHFEVSGLARALMQERDAK
jgi:hypothetical protein